MTTTPSSRPFGNEVIEASAGSGKTYQLSNRIIKLLAHGVEPSAIVALTFTRAAAGEFVAKTLEKLAKAAANQADPKTGKYPAEELRAELALDASWDAERWRALLRRTVLSMHRMTLGTLDSFFARQIANNPLEVGIKGADVGSLGEGEATLARNQALMETLGKPGQKLEDLVASLDAILEGKAEATPFRKLADQIDDLHNLYALANAPGTWGEEACIWGGRLPLLFQPVSSAELKEAQAVLRKWVDTAKSISTKKTKKPMAELHGTAKNYIIRYVEGIPVIKEAAKLSDRHEDFCTGKMEPVINCTSPRGIEHAYPKGYTTHYPANICDALRRLARHVYTLKLSQKTRQTKELRKLLEDFEKAHAAAVRDRGRLTFSDNVNLLLRAQDLGTPIDLGYRLDCKALHWLFDEFQDTSTRQWKVLRGSLERKEVKQGGSTFFVGDPKQSLYGWRGGNHELLRHQRSLAHPEGNGRQLTKTRRCCEPVVDLVNAVFGKVADLRRGILPEAACSSWKEAWKNHGSLCEDARVGETLWVQLKAAEEQDDDAKPRYATDGDSNSSDGEGREDSEDRVVNQARWIGWHIKRSMMLDGRLLAKGVTCAILVSKNREAAMIAEELRRMGIEAADEAETPVVTDNPLGAVVLALAKWAAFPDDGQSLGIIKMSPIGRAFLEEHASKGHDLPAGQVAIAQIFHAGGAEELVRRILASFRIEPAAAGNLSNAQRFLRRRHQELIQLAVAFDESQPRDLVGLTHYLQEASMRGNADRRAVQVLTVHHAKGLEYTAVYLPCLNSHIKMDEGRTEDPLMALDKGFEPRWILSRPSKFLIDADPKTLGEARSREQASAAYESLCKLYVGMTRAVRRLVLVSDEIPGSELAKSGAIKPGPGSDGEAGDGSKRISPDLATLLHLTLNPGEPVPYTEMSGDGIPEAHLMFRPTGQPKDPAEAARPWLEVSRSGKDKSPVFKALPPIEAAPAIRPVRIKPSGDKKPREPKERRTGAANGRQVGIAVHELMRHLEWDVDGFLAELRKEEIPLANPRFRKEATALILGCLRNAEVRQALESGIRGSLLWREREAAVPTQDAEGKAALIHAVFDRVHVTPGKEAVIIDFKTDSGLKDSELREAHKGQMALYRKAVHELTQIPEASIRCLLVHMREGTLVACP